MRHAWRTLGTPVVALSLLVAPGAFDPAPLQGQEPAAPEAEVDRERMTQFVRAHMAINDARDEFHGEVARVHDQEGRTRARQRVEEAINGILEGQEMTREEYDEITLLISLDGDLRAMFDEILVQLQEARSAPG